MSDENLTIEVPEYNRDYFYNTISYINKNNNIVENVFDVLSFKFLDLKDYLRSKPLQLYVIEAGKEFRPDLISYDIYSDTQYWYIICLINDIIDPMEDLVVGTTLIYPELYIIENFYNELLQVELEGRTVSLGV